MRLLYLLLSCLLADIAASEPSQSGFDLDIDGNSLDTGFVRRASLRKTWEPAKPRRVVVSSSTSKNQASSDQAASGQLSPSKVSLDRKSSSKLAPAQEPSTDASSSKPSSNRASPNKDSLSKASSGQADSNKASSSKLSSGRESLGEAAPGKASSSKASSSKASSSKAPPIEASSSGQASASRDSAAQWLQNQMPSHQFYDIYLPMGRSSSGESDSSRRSASPTRIGSPVGPGRSAGSRETSPTPPVYRPPPTRSPNLRSPLMMPSGPMRIPTAPPSWRRAPTRPPQPTERTADRSPERPPRPQGVVSGHPNSAMVLVKGPGWMEVRKSNGVAEVATVPPGKWDYIHHEDKHGLFAVGRSMGDGTAIAASTGNAAAGYVAVGQGGRGYVQTHDGPVYKEREVGEGNEFRQHVRGDDTKKPKGAALASIQGHGQVTAVAMEREVP